jgi:hypothetical protein
LVLAIACAVVLPAAQAVAQNIFTGDCIPPPAGSYVGAFHAKYSDGTNVYDLSNPIHAMFSSCGPPPSSGGCSNHSFGSGVSATLSVNAGAPMSVGGPANCTVRVCSTFNVGPTRFFDTEMLQLDISGGPLLIRESPTRPSLGKTSITDLGGGLYQIDSFFDVFTELSLNGGATWLPSTDEQGNPYAGRVLIPGTVSVENAKWSKVKFLYK